MILDDNNDDDIHDDDGDNDDDYANWNEERPSCQLSGGFRFRAIKKLTGEDICEKEWRWSTLEIECMKGDGMTFITPASNTKCNPFTPFKNKKRLVCWAVWESNDFTFMIASDVSSKQPKYCLRFPKNLQGDFIVLVYFSAFCPTHVSGKALPEMEYYEFRMHRRDPNKCEDDDEGKCRSMFRTPDDCAKNRSYALHCPLSCKRCPVPVREELESKTCQFQEILIGNWRYYTKRHFDTEKVTVNITPAVATFSHLSHFECLDRDKMDRKYKMVSFFENGCAPRFTCVEFNRQTANVLQYRISASERLELPMDQLCTFRDDPEPQKDFIRSYQFRNLIRERGFMSSFMPAFCGLSGKIPFDGTVNGHNCSGMVSDWDENRCTAVGTFALTSNTCKELVLPMEFQCLSFISEEEVKQELVITRSLDGTNTYNCWILTDYMKLHSLPLGVRMFYRMPTAQCTLGVDIADMSDGISDAVLYLNYEEKKHECNPQVPVLTSRVTKIVTTNPDYVVHSNKSLIPQETAVDVESNQSKDTSGQSSPITDPHRTERPYKSVSKDSTSCISYSIEILTAIVFVAKALPGGLFGS
ncbi:hypothetical protein ElyMa_006089700 [Elysia marginata]|uniref:DUF7043 domain-containing protein n=1 Tax=Elysia marginata TaxID=1093978 RepID=A0AAV4GRJ4_9GAST|nr:hypothetical protein ElyMa_006089700 [Elysia marginata]